MPLPVITGIGHERDESITDMVAHTHLRTPTAVGEFLISGLAQFEGLLEEYRDRMKRRFEKLMYNEDTKLRTFQHQIRQFVSVSVQKQAYNLDYLYRKMKDSTSRYFEKHFQELANQEAAINLLDPERVLQRGYTITTYNGKILKNKIKVQKGDYLKTYSKHQVIDSKVTLVNKK
jgi:exodeoxyribonuclease VII large subunit